MGRRSLRRGNRSATLLGRTIAAGLTVALVGCGGTRFTDVSFPPLPEYRIVFEAPESTSGPALDQVIAILRGRLETTGYQELAIDLLGTTITVAVDQELTATEREAMIELVTRPGELTLRPVINLNLLSSPAFLDGTLPEPGEEPAAEGVDNLDPETGLTIDDDPSSETYLLGADGYTYYHLGPAFLSGSDLAGADAAFTGGAGAPSSWVVDPRFTDEGGEKFREATGLIALEPSGSPARALAIVLDGTVFSAPALAPEVGPDGLDPEAVIITVAGGETEAMELAAVLQYGALPVALTVVESD